MIPFTYPSKVVEGQTACVIKEITPGDSDVAWETYIPVKETYLSEVNTYEADGSVGVSVLADTSGKTSWIDYIPVAVVGGSNPWRTDADGHIPVEVLEGALPDMKINTTAEAIRAAINDPTAWGETLGPELVSNGTFATNTTGWTTGNSATFVSSSGAGLLTNGAAANGYAFQILTTTAGRAYKATFSFTLGTGPAPRLEAGTSENANNLGSITVTASGSYELLFTATTATTWLTVKLNSVTAGLTATFDNISVREVVTGWLLPGSAGARLSGDCRTSVAMQTEADGTVGYAAHNLLTNSDAFDNAAWVKGNTTVVANAGTAPDGTTTADLVYPSTTGVARTIYQNSSGATVISSVALFVKASGKSWVWVVGPAGSSNSGVYFNVSTGVVGTQNSGYTGSITSVGNGWYRCSVNAPLAAMNYAQITLVDADNTDSITTNGTDGLLVWGAQLNLGPTALPYVPTTTAARYGPAIDWLSGIGAYGIRSEAARTNLLVRSTEFNDAAWAKNDVTVSANTATAPDGTLSADTATFILAGELYQSVSVSASTQYTFSFWALRGTATALNYFVYNSSTPSTIIGDTSYYSQTSASAWARISVPFTTPVGCTSIRVYVNRTATAGTVFFWGAQLEAGTEASSPILTYAATATRAADILLVPNTSPGWIGQSFGTMAAEGIAKTIGVNGVLSLNDASAANQASIRSDNSAVVTLSSSSILTPAIATMAAGVFGKSAMGYSLRYAAASRDAAIPTTTGDSPGFTQLQLGGLSGSGTANINGHLTRIKYTDQALPNDFIKALAT